MAILTVRVGKMQDLLNDVLLRYNHQQLVAESTHEAGNTLDLLIVPDSNAGLVTDVTVHALCFSDHSLVRC